LGRRGPAGSGWGTREDNGGLTMIKVITYVFENDIMKHIKMYKKILITLQIVITPVFKH
jgi:hypothetical protein